MDTNTQLSIPEARELLLRLSDLIEGVGNYNKKERNQLIDDLIKQLNDGGYPLFDIQDLPPDQKIDKVLEKVSELTTKELAATNNNRVAPPPKNRKIPTLEEQLRLIRHRLSTSPPTIPVSDANPSDKTELVTRALLELYEVDKLSPEQTAVINQACDNPLPVGLNVISAVSTKAFIPETNMLKGRHSVTLVVDEEKGPNLDSPIKQVKNNVVQPTSDSEVGQEEPESVVYDSSQHLSPKTQDKKQSTVGVLADGPEIGQAGLVEEDLNIAASDEPKSADLWFQERVEEVAAKAQLTEQILERLTVQTNQKPSTTEVVNAINEVLGDRPRPDDRAGETKQLKQAVSDLVEKVVSEKTVAGKDEGVSTSSAPPALKVNDPHLAATTIALALTFSNNDNPKHAEVGETSKILSSEIDKSEKINKLKSQGFDYSEADKLISLHQELLPQLNSGTPLESLVVGNKTEAAPVNKALVNFLSNSKFDSNRKINNRLLVIFSPNTKVINEAANKLGEVSGFRSEELELMLKHVAIKSHLDVYSNTGGLLIPIINNTSPGNLGALASFSSNTRAYGFSSQEVPLLAAVFSAGHDTQHQFKHGLNPETIRALDRLQQLRPEELKILEELVYDLFPETPVFSYPGGNSNIVFQTIPFSSSHGLNIIDHLQPPSFDLRDSGGSSGGGGPNLRMLFDYVRPNITNLGKSAESVKRLAKIKSILASLWGLLQSLMAALPAMIAAIGAATLAGILIAAKLGALALGATALFGTFFIITSAIMSLMAPIVNAPADDFVIVNKYVEHLDVPFEQCPLLNSTFRSGDPYLISEDKRKSYLEFEDNDSWVELTHKCIVYNVEVKLRDDFFETYDSISDIRVFDALSLITKDQSLVVTLPESLVVPGTGMDPETNYSPQTSMGASNPVMIYSYAIHADLIDNNTDQEAKLVVARDALILNEFDIYAVLLTKEGEEVEFRLASSVGGSAKSMIAIGDAPEIEGLAGGGVCWPTTGVISQGPSAGHKVEPNSMIAGIGQAIDIAGNLGEPVYNSHAGRVRVKRGGAYGNHVVVDAGTYSTLYAHLNEINVKDMINGATVQPGTLVGTQGWTGNVIPKSIDGTHLHYELSSGGTIKINSIVPSYGLRTRVVQSCRK